MSYMNVQRPKVSPKLLLLLDTNVLEILVTEDDQTPLRNKEGQLVFLLPSQLRQLKTADLSPDDGSNLRDGQVGIVVLGEEVPLLPVRHEAPVVEFEGLGGWECGRFVVDGEVGAVLVLRYRTSTYMKMACSSAALTWLCSVVSKANLVLMTASSVDVLVVVMVKARTEIPGLSNG